MTVIDQCDWDHPGRDVYTGTARAAIMQMVQIPEAIRLTLIERAEAKTPQYDDVVMIDRDTVTGKYGYRPDIEFMAFGSRGRVCKTVSRAKWGPTRVESAMVFCSGAYCILRPSICNNWAIIQREPEQRTPPSFASEPPDYRETTPAGGVSELPPIAGTPAVPSDAVFVPGLSVTPGGFVAVGYPVPVPYPVGYPYPVYTPPVVAAPIPEPATWAQMLAAFILAFILWPAGKFRRLIQSFRNPS